MKKLAVTVVVLLLLCAGTWVGLDRWGAGKLHAYEAVWKGKIASQREADARRRMPVLRGSASRDENAATIEKDVLARIDAHPVSKTALSSVMTRSPFAPPGEGEMAALEENRAVADDLARAAQCTRCDREVPYERGVEAPLPNLHSCRAAVNLALAAGHERARAGDLRGAADRYLDAARFGADIGGGLLIEAMIGAALEHPALRSLGALATDAPAGAAAPFDEIDAALKVLEPSLPDAAGAIRSEGLFAGGIAKMINETGALSTIEMMPSGLDGPGLLDVFAGRAIVAQALPLLDEINERTAAAAALPERAARDRALSEIEAMATSSKNPIVAISTPSSTKAIESLITVRSRLAVTRLALAVEKRRLAEGKAPSLEEKDLPVDPSAAPAKLHYEVTGGGAGYRIWSVGANGQDDGGLKDENGGGARDDLLAERKAP